MSIKQEYYKPAWSFITEGVCKLEVMLLGGKIVSRVTLDISEEERNQIAFDVLEGEKQCQQ